MLRMLILIGLLMFAIPAVANASSWIYVYEDGVPVGYLVGQDFEFYSVDPADIAQANQELLDELLGYGPQRASVGFGLSENNADTAAAEQYKPRPDGVSVSGVSVRDYLSPGDWQAVYGDWFGRRSWYAELDKSGTHWNWDSTSFDTAGHVYGLDANEDSSPKYLRGDRERYMTEAVWRRGSMDGSAFSIRGLAYETNIRGGGEQPVDVKLKRVLGEFRTVEHGYNVNGAAFGGKYVSNRLAMDNTFIGGQLEAGHWVNRNLGIFADGTTTLYDIGGTDADVTRNNWGGSVILQGGDVSLTGYGRQWSEATDLAANSHLRGYDDLGARVEYRPAGDAYFSAGYRKRDVNYERLRLEDPAIFDTFFSDPPPSRSDWNTLREQTNASSDRLDATARVQLAQGLYFGANYSRDDWDTLPPAGSMNLGATVPSYFADMRTKRSAQLSYNMRCNGRVTLRSEELSSTNGDRNSQFDRISHALNYSSAFCRTARFGLGVSRTETTLDLPDIAQDWNADSWSYDLTLAGESGAGDYRFSYRRNAVDGASGGDYDSLGLEINLDQVPVSISAWWRERQDALAGDGSFDDAGVNLGYYFEVR